MKTVNCCEFTFQKRLQIIISNVYQYAFNNLLSAQSPQGHHLLCCESTPKSFRRSLRVFRVVHPSSVRVYLNGIPLGEPNHNKPSLSLSLDLDLRLRIPTSLVHLKTISKGNQGVHRSEKLQPGGKPINFSFCFSLQRNGIPPSAAFECRGLHAEIEVQGARNANLLNSQ